jgi:general secretion pathway protein D
MCLLLTACASPYDFKSPAVAPNVKDEIELTKLQEQAEKEPKNFVLRAHIARQKEYLGRKFLEEAAAALQNNDFDGANGLLDKVLAINPASPGAKDGKHDVESARRHQEWFKDAQDQYSKGNLDQAEAKLKTLLIEDPFHSQAKSLMRQVSRKKDVNPIPAALKANISKPITLEFKETSLKTIFELISRSSNINFIFDKEVKGDTKATVFVRNTKIEEAIHVILVTNQLAKKILSENTILIYPNTPAKNKEYQELMVRNFYLANADIKQTVNVIKTIVKTTDIVYDEKLNMLTMRDTPEAIRLAEKLIAAQDMAEPEVMLELEVLEVSRNRLQEIGVRLPEKVSFSALSAAGGSAGSLTIDEWRGLNSSRIRASITDPSLILNLRRLDTDTNLLANPRIRVKNREKAKVHIGERVPVITTTSTANVGISESVAYLDVGLKLDIEPNVYLEDEVSMKVGLEVSNILETIVRASGTQTYRLGTRNTSTTLRLKDGETQILAGLIQDDERKAVNKIPGIASLPIIGKLFSNSDTTNTKTEIVLLITPRIIRNINQPEIDIAEFTSGTADAIGAAPLQVKAQESKVIGNPSTLSLPMQQISVPNELPASPVNSTPMSPAKPLANGTMPVPLPAPPNNTAPDASLVPPITIESADVQVSSPAPVASPTNINAP